MGSSCGLITATFARQDLGLYYLQRYQHHVGACQKYKITSPTADLLIENL